MSQQDTAAPETRATELLRTMTVEEKAQQVTGLMPVHLVGVDGLLKAEADRALGLGIGHIAAVGMFGHKTPTQVAKVVNDTVGEWFKSLLRKEWRISCFDVALRL